MEITAGATRTVILTKWYAIKIPRVYRKGRPFEWKHFLYGMIANLQESYWSSFNIKELCPVLFADRLGFVCIMPRCQPLNDANEEDLKAFIETEEMRLPVDPSPENFGILNGEMVALDYGT